MNDFTTALSHLEYASRHLMMFRRDYPFLKEDISKGVDVVFAERLVEIDRIMLKINRYLVRKDITEEDHKFLNRRMTAVANLYGWIIHSRSQVDFVNNEFYTRRFLLLRTKIDRFFANKTKKKRKYEKRRSKNS